MIKTIALLLALAAAACSPGKGQKKDEVAAHGAAARPPHTPQQEEYRQLALTNPCPEGYKRMQGIWRFAGQTRTPDFESVMRVDGVTYSESLSGKPDGVATTARIEGEVRCLFKNRVLFMIDEVEPEGAFGNRSGESFPCDVLGDMDPDADKIMLICYIDWDLRTAAGLEYEYERVEEKKP